MESVVVKSRIRYVYAFIAGLLASIPIYNILLLEILASMAIILRPSLLANSFKGSFARVGLLFISAFALLVSSLLNETPFLSLLKGVFALILFSITVLYLVYYFRPEELWLTLFVFYASSAIFRISSSQETFVDLQGSFKFGYSQLAVFLVLSIPNIPNFTRVSFLRRVGNIFAPSSFAFVFLSSIIITVLAWWGNLRLLAFCNILAIISWSLFAFPVFLAGKYKSHFFKSLPFIAVIIPLAFVALSISLSYVGLFSLDILSNMGFVSQDAVTKTFEQSSGLLGVLFGGRVEVFSALLAWSSKPFLGWGSWPLDPNFYYTVGGFAILEELGYKFSELAYIIQHAHLGLSLPWIPTHSFLLQSLVWSGSVGFIPAYWFVCKVQKLFLSAHGSRLPFLLHYMNALLLWNILFSPFGWPNRINLALTLSYLLTSLVPVQGVGQLGANIVSAETLTTASVKSRK